MGTNEILPFGDTASGGNILTQAAYAIDAQRNIGHQPGTARQELENKVLRQTSLVAAAVAQATADNITEDVVDTLSVSTLAARFIAGVRAFLWKKTTVASAASPDIFAATVGHTIDYTGTTTCTGFTAAPFAGAQRTLVCAAAAPFTAGANLLIDGYASGQTYTAAPGDRVLVIALTTTQFRLTPQRVSGAGALIPIRTQVASASAAIDFTSGITSAYDEYIFTLTDIIPATDGANLLMRVSQDGGSTFKAGASDYAFAKWGWSSTAGAPAGSTGDTSIIIVTALSNASATRSQQLKISMWNPAGAVLAKYFTWQHGHVDTSGAVEGAVGTGLFKLNQAAIDGIRFLMSSGNITSGTFTLYGVRKP